MTVVPEQSQQVGSGSLQQMVQYYLSAEETQQLCWIHMSHVLQAAEGGSLWVLKSVRRSVTVKYLCYNLL